MRYAIYLTPPAGDPLTLAASRWLGRDAFSGEALVQPDVAGISPPELAGATAEPRRYGFHATIKAPFGLAAGVSEEQLLQSFADFAATTSAFTIPALVPVRHGPFFALHEDAPCAPLQNFAAAAVRHFEPLRAPLDEQDIARRNPDRLPERQRDYLLTWGYPYVFEEFRFHMTLTGALDAQLAERIEPELRRYFAPFTGRPLAVSSVALFVEPARGAPFTVHSTLPLAAADAGENA